LSTHNQTKRGDIIEDKPCHITAFDLFVRLL
jgi:hypothetical protein